MPYRIRIEDDAQRALRTIGGFYRGLARQEIQSLAHDPRPPRSQELDGYPGRFRIWLGSKYRLPYAIDDDAQVVWVQDLRLKTGPETYDDVP